MGGGQLTRSRERTGCLQHATCLRIGKVGSPTGREPYGDGASVVVGAGESPPTRHPHVDGQAASGGHPDDSGGLLRAAILSTVTRLSARSRVSHRTTASLPYVEWYSVVH